MIKSWAEHSRGNWSDKTGGYPSDDRIKIGCLQRIAAALETVAGNNATTSKQLALAQDHAKYWEKECKAARVSKNRYKKLYRKLLK